MTTKQLLRGSVVATLLLAVSLLLVVPSLALEIWAVGYLLILPISYITLLRYFAVGRPRWPSFRAALVSGGVLATTAAILSYIGESNHLTNVDKDTFTPLVLTIFLHGSWFSLLLSYCLKPPRARRLGARLGLSAGALVVWFLFHSGLVFQDHWLWLPASEPVYAALLNAQDFYYCLLLVTVILGWAAFVGSQLGLIVSEE